MDSTPQTATPTKLKDLPKKQRGIIRAWCMYDWANSAYSTSGITAIFPVYFVFLFKEALGENASFLGITFTGSSMWTVGVVVSTSIVALSTPVLGVIADRVPIKKTLLWVYIAAGAVCTVLVFFSVYTAHPWAWMLGMLALAGIGFSGSQVFYNSFLPHLAPRELLDDVSSRGYAYGYAGGGLMLFVHLVVIFATQDTGIADLVTRLAIVSVGVWWFGWSVWTLMVVPEPPIPNPVRGMTVTRAVSLAFSELGKTFRELTRFRVVLVYLISYLLFNDGLQTVMAIAGAFAADTIGIPLIFNMLTILTVQIVAIFGAMAFAWLAGRTSTKAALVASLIGWILVVLFGVAIVRLVPVEHGDFEYQLRFQQTSGDYLVENAPELGDSKIDTLWKDEAGTVSEGDTLSSRQATTLLGLVERSENSPYSLSIAGGALNGETAVGTLHPSTIGDGLVDWWPDLVRKLIWRPLGLDASYQWLILGACVGLVIGGSQALARSLFAHITPMSRSGEFFSFFGFMSRASTVFGPLLYIAATAVFDTRVAITSILIVLVAGTIMLRWVNIAEGERVAAEEDARHLRENEAPA